MHTIVFTRGDIITDFVTYIKKIHKTLLLTKIYTSFLLVISFILTASIFFYLTEKSYNQNLNTVYDAVWWGLVTSATVGYGDIYPVTTLGRIIASIVILTGISFFGFIAASITSLIVENNFKKGMGLLDIAFKEHIIIVGWNYRSKSIIQELVNEDKNIKIVLIDNIEQNPYSNKNIFFIKGNGWDETVLNRSNLKDAKTAIVLGDKDQSNTEMSDAKSVLTCLAIDKINPNVYLVAEVINHENVIHFTRTNVNDIIVSSEIESKVIVRSILYKGVSKAFKELITNAFGNELYEEPIKKSFNGKTYLEIVKGYLDYKATVIGFSRGNETYVNPNKDEVLIEGDKLIYIANEKLNLKI